MFKDNDHRNLKILVITPSYPDKDNLFIGESFVKNQLDSLKDYVKEIIVISPTLFTFKIMQKDRICENYSYDNVKVYFPRCFYIPIFYLSKILIDNRLEVIENLIKHEDIQFDLIHSHFSWPSAYIGIRIKEKFGVPTIVTIHENAEWLNKEISMNYPLMNSAWIKADALIRVNKIDVPILKKFNRNVFSIPNGFSPRFKSLSKIECMTQLHLPMNKKIIFSLGYLIKRKGFNYLIDAIRMVTEKRKDVLCFIGGSGPLETKLQKQINNLDLQENIKLLGLVPDKLLPIWMNACNVFVLSSLSEGNPTVMFECLGCGKPFIGTRVGGVPEIIISEDYGLMCEPADSGELAKNLLLALDKDWDVRKIESYSTQFAWDVISKETLKVYSDLCHINYDRKNRK
jgi:glycosyltransferase involved in cell wall biosynthesis